MEFIQLHGDPAVDGPAPHALSSRYGRFRIREALRGDAGDDLDKRDLPEAPGNTSRKSGINAAIPFHRLTSMVDRA
ncbi:hypothetical protein [Catenuloplanes japonicus]|uniref:hypothetical protein n=1 Tax=Catenuloplanes japonicus TaxID=33876 RepID=UPI0012F99CB8|nr:hypothetical protein [Catenuloplanes japonicus]